MSVAPVDLGRTFVLVSYASPGAGVDIGSRLLTASLVDNTTLQLDRALAGDADDIDDIVWQIVELKDGSRVQSGTASFGAAAAQASASLSLVDLDHAVAFSPVQGGAGQSAGLSDLSGSSIPGVAATTLELLEDKLLLERDCASGSAEVGWFVVEFAK